MVAEDIPARGWTRRATLPATSSLTGPHTTPTWVQHHFFFAFHLLFVNTFSRVDLPTCEPLGSLPTRQVLSVRGSLFEHNRLATRSFWREICYLFEPASRLGESKSGALILVCSCRVMRRMISTLFNAVVTLRLLLFTFAHRHSNYRHLWWVISKLYSAVQQQKKIKTPAKNRTCLKIIYHVFLFPWISCRVKKWTNIYYSSQWDNNNPLLLLLNYLTT